MKVFGRIARRLVDAGVPIEEVGELIAEATLELSATTRSTGAIRQERYRRNKASQSVTSVTSDGQERKGSVPPKERILPSSDTSYPQSEVARDLGKRVGEALRSLGPLPDEAKSFHDACEASLRKAGFVVFREWEIDLGAGRHGYIDLVVMEEDRGVAIELDRRLPRAKSLKKLSKFDGYRICVTRTANSSREFEGMVDEVIAVPVLPSENPKFQEFWKVFPARKGSNPKYPARQKFDELVRQGIDPDAIIGGARGYAAAAGKDANTEFICTAVVFLNQRRWEDYAPKYTPEQIEEYARQRRERTAIEALAPSAAPPYTPSPEEVERGREWYARRRMGKSGIGMRAAGDAVVHLVTKMEEQKRQAS
jgi:hypothetical protein